MSYPFEAKKLPKQIQHAGIREETGVTLFREEFDGLCYIKREYIPTSSRGDAVTFDYEVLAYPDTDLHRADTDAFAGALIPAQAGIHDSPDSEWVWIPAFAGMTIVCRNDDYAP